MFGIIYLHKNKVNGRCYVGQTKQNPNRRWRKSDITFHSYKSCEIFYRALKKYGWDNFETTILVSCFSQENINILEEYFINYYNSLAPNGYNGVAIVDQKSVYTDESKKKMSDKRKEYCMNNKIIAVNKKEHVFIDGIEHRECSSCKISKTLDFFMWQEKKSRYHPYCKPCHKVKVAATRTPYEKVSEERYKQSYIDRGKKSGVIISNSPEIRAKLAAKKRKAIIGTSVTTGETIEFDSALKAKESGFQNTNIGQAIKLNKAYRGYTWKFKD